MTETFFGLSLFGALLTLNVHRPVRRLGFLAIPSFFLGWLVGDLAIFHVAIQAVVTIGFVSAGVLEHGLGQAGLAITLVSWAGLLWVWPISLKAGPIAQAALDQSLGPLDASKLPAAEASGLAHEPGLTRALRPFSFRVPGVKVIRNIAYHDDHPERHLLDVYLPEGGVEGAPVLLQIHGGAWTIGHKREQALPLMYHMASHGWICVATNYRLAPKHAWPAHIEDCKRATAWIKQHIAEYGGDPGFVCVTGGSAGGHLSSLVALSANDPDWQPGFEDVDTSFAAAVPFYGVYDWSNEFGLQANDMTGFLERIVMKKPFAGNEELYRKASPMHRIHADAPPFFVLHGDADSLCSVEEARGFVARLREVSKRPVAYAEVPGAQHAFEIFHTPRTVGVVPAVERFLSQMHGQYLARTGSESAAATA